MSKKILSIIVLSWNRPKYTRQTIECLLKKTTVPNELILVDNNSDESTGVKKYLNSVTGNKYTENIIHVFNKANRGVAGGRNSGIHVCSGEYIFNIDDDILVPDNYDKMMIDACDKIAKLGVVGISVEPFKYPKATMNGVPVRIKSVGNINGAALCLPRRVFKIVGYYNSFGTNLYSHEDAYLSYVLKHLGLIGVYIPPRGVHLDKDLDKEYRKAKNKTHVKGSPELSSLSGAVMLMKKTNNVYTPYTEFGLDKQPDTHTKFDNDLILKGRK